LSEPGIIIQARLNSSRFQRKILHPINDKKVIDIVLDECIITDLETVVAYPYGETDLSSYLSKKVSLFEGPENDVIARFYRCAKLYEFDPIIRVCADAKNIHHELILQQLENYKKFGHMIYGNFCEVFSFKQLEDYYLHDKRPETREHVTMGMISDLTVDYEIDLN